MKKSIIIAGIILTGIISSLSAKARVNKYAGVDTSSVEEVTPEMQAIAKRNNETYGEKLARSFTKSSSKDKFFEFDSSTIFTSGATGGIKQRDTVIVLNPDNQMAGFGSTYLLAYYYVLMNSEARKSFSEAVKKYHSDFANKKLKRKENQTFKTYGKIPVRIEWGSFKNSVKNYANTYAYLGYSFYKKSPYFTITIYPKDNENLPMSLSSDYEIETSLSLKYSMTKAQSMALADFVSDEVVQPLLLQYAAAVNNIYGNNTAADDYSDSEEYYEEN